MDKKKTNASASASGEKPGEKKEGNFLTKTAHSIRDKVHGFTDEVKEKTHNLTHSGEAKKNKKEKDSKKTDTKSKTPSKTPGAAKEGPGSDSDDEDESPPPASGRGAASTVSKKDNERDAGKAGALEPKSSRGGGAAAATTTTEKKDTAPTTTEKRDTAPTTNSRFPSDKPTSRDSANKSSDDNKDTTGSSSKPTTSENSVAKPPPGAPTPNESKPSIDKSNKASEGGDTTNKPSSEQKNSDHVHLSFAGVVTVDDLLDRIDDAVEKAKIVVENTPGAQMLNIGKTTRRPTPSQADLEKIPLKKSDDDKNKAGEKKEDNKTENDKEPIRLNYNEIHNIQDILSKINGQEGHRKVILENTPNNSSSINVKLQSDPSSTSNENDDPSGPPKSILKTSQDPSSLDTSTKVSSFQDDQIHVNIEGIQNLDDLLDRVDDAVQTVPIIIDSKSQGEKRQAPQPPNPNDNNKQLASSFSLPHKNDDNNQLSATISVPSQKREAPKAPITTNDAPQINKKRDSGSEASQTNKAQGDDKPAQANKKQGDDEPTETSKKQGSDKAPTFKVPEHEFEGKSDPSESSPSSRSSSLASSSTDGKKKDEDSKTDWV